jgi:hypothetical protein
MAIDPNIFEKKQEEWQQLTEELNRVEWEHASRLMTWPQTGEVWFPKPWIDALNETPVLRSLTAKLTPLETRDLSPMSQKLRDLAKIFELPPYKGKAKPNPPPKESPEKQMPERKQKRCPMCGGWMWPSEVIAWKKHQTNMMDILTFPRSAEFSGEMTCKDCGHHDG